MHCCKSEHWRVEGFALHGYLDPWNERRRAERVIVMICMEHRSYHVAMLRVVHRKQVVAEGNVSVFQNDHHSLCKIAVV